MVATYQDVTVEQGETFRFTVDLLDLATGEARTDLDGFTGSMQIRADQSLDGELLGEADVTVDADNSQVTAVIPDDETALYDWNSGYYTLRITDGSSSERIAEGRVKLDPGVST